VTPEQRAEALEILASVDTKYGCTYASSRPYKQPCGQENQTGQPCVACRARLFLLRLHAEAAAAPAPARAPLYLTFAGPDWAHTCEKNLLSLLEELVSVSTNLDETLRAASQYSNRFDWVLVLNAATKDHVAIVASFYFGKEEPFDPAPWNPSQARQW
jgi:hypothetical protein